MSDRIVEIQLPKLGESIVSATVVQWLKEEGDVVMKDEPILEVSTDKVNSEIPAPHAGVLTEKLAFENEELDVGAPLAKILTEKHEKVLAAAAPTTNCPMADQEEKNDFLSPAVLNLARKKGISVEELYQIKGSGQSGRVTKKDVEDFIEKPSLNNAQETPNSGIEKLPMSGLRKAIAENMVRSFYQAPHASLVAEVDVTNIMESIKANKASFMDQHGVKITITSYMIQAIAQAATKYPMVNASVDKDTILMKRFVNLGIAVSIENGVVVPVIKDCHMKDLPTIAKDVARLSDRARNNTLNQEDVQEGSITMTNFGMTGMHMGVPIIRHPEVAIVGIGSIHKTVSPISDTAFGIRQKVFLTLTFDHRVIDGIYGADFLGYIKTSLENVT
ncbi:MAG: Dihydrolipoyllysine-residue succinyltransferase component of 2-oxoglutarate dehydrogenase complex [Chlamydiae bacterium]|nr:Dihydrolipoyllysine-residue succinyltransferase component of 2-oxoglutarate dehydrogenase complex [Chlamydiota bacterium]